MGFYTPYKAVFDVVKAAIITKTTPIVSNTTLSPTDDAWVREASPNENFGVTDQYFDVFSYNANRNRRSFLKFDLSVLPVGAIITLAQLKTHCGAKQNLIADVTDVEARKVADDTWLESTVTWNNQPTYGEVVATTPPIIGWNISTVTNYVKAELATDKKVSLCMKCKVESYDATDRGSEFKTTEYYNPIYCPVLYIEYTVMPPLKTVILGEQFTVGGLPKAIINAEPAPVEPAEMGDMLSVKVNFSVVLVILEYEPKDWFTDIIKVMGEIVDAILADRTLAGTVKDVIPTGFAPGEIRFKDKLFFGGVIRFTAVMWFAP
jgi:hypothetical protein